MRTSKDVEAYLLRMGRTYHEVGGHDVAEGGDGTWMVRVEREETAIVRCSDPLLVTRVDVGPAPAAGAKGREALFEKLLRLNATGLVHAAYGIDDGTVVLAAALPLENLDYNELEALLAELDLAAAQQIPEIRAGL